MSTAQLSPGNEPRRRAAMTTESDWVWTDDPTSSFGLLKDANYTLGDDCAAITWKGEWLPTNCAELLPFFCEADLKGSANLTDHDSNLTGNERMANNPLSRGLFSNCSLMSHKTTRSECIQYIIHSSRILCQKSIPLDRIIPLDFPDKPSLIMDILAVIRAELQEDLTFQSCNHHINVLDFLEELLNAVIYAVDIGNYLSLTAEDTGNLFNKHL
ncbi:uncharacterized protein LOC128210774 [Mya arenaria]|uniref:uncharacterized protein LOC128210774 n=1 Tax=Mya arenaria TaxID=6604 RepID=UPI0022E542D1|nr:uncharacterized protein LOC128210774 [Mya arenaria]